MTSSLRCEQRRTCLWLAGVGTWNPGALRRLYRRFGGLDGVLEESRERLASILSSSARAARAAAVMSTGDGRWVEAAAYADVLAAASEAGSRASRHGPTVTWVDRDYPCRLRELADPPPALFLAGESPIARLSASQAGPVVAVVGTRAPSSYGREMAAAIAGGLSRAGVMVVSGLAMGIDAVAHAAALGARGSTTDPRTLAVLGCGADVVYPRANRRLFERIRAEGVVVSEFTWGAGARSWRFPARNRTMAGLADAVVVVEGAERSGALYTADFCNDLGREPLAVPGEAGRRLSAGPHRLLREGRAGLCESAADVLAALGENRAVPAPRSPGTGGSQVDGGAADVLLALDGGELLVDELAALVHLPVGDCLTALAELELEGLVDSAGGGRYRRVRGRGES